MEAALESIGGAGAAWSAAAMQLEAARNLPDNFKLFFNVDLELGRDTR